MDLPAASDTARFTELSPASYASPATSALLVFGVAPGILLAAIALALIRTVRMRLRLPRMLATPGAVLVEGEVEPDGEGTSPVQLTIVQSREPVKGSLWLETGRAVTARPFGLRTAGGSLRIEPDERTTLATRLDEVGPEPGGRAIAASLTPGMRVYVVGVREKGSDPRGGDYRGSPAAVVVRPPPGRGMLIAAAPPDRLFRARAWFHLKWGLVLLVILGLDPLWFTGYFEREAKGEVVWAHVIDAREWKTRRSDRHGYHLETHYGITAETSGKQTLDAEIGEEDQWLQSQGTIVPFLVVPASSASQLGTRASASGVSILGGLLTSLIAALAFLGSSRMTRLWFDRRQVNHAGTEFVDKGPPMISPL
jgi:hypothetical protein